MSKLIKKLRPLFTHLIQVRPLHLPPHTKLIVGVSGGADSLTLLHVLKAIYPPRDLIVAHVNHQLRPSAAAEARFVQEVSEAWHIPYRPKNVDVTGLASEQNLSLEAAGRLARYQYFGQLAIAEGARTVMVAHHADDQAETVLMHLLRGSGLAGLRGMKMVSPLPQVDDCLLIRPFLHTARAEIEAYCQEQNLRPIVDESNRDTRFLRNRVRHELLPIMADYNPQIRARLQQLAATVAADYEVIEAALAESWTAVFHNQTTDTIQLKRAKWLDLPLSLRRRSLRRAVEELRPFTQEIGFQAIEQARHVIEKGHTGAQSMLPGDLILVLGYKQVTITAEPQPLIRDLPQLPDEQRHLLAVPGTLPLANGWRLTASLVDSLDQSQIVHNDDAWMVFVAAAEMTELIVRGRLVGERLRPLGMKGRSMKLKDVMINRKIPAYLRTHWPLIVHQGQIVWVVGHQLDERAQVGPETERIVKIECRPI